MRKLLCAFAFALALAAPAAAATYKIPDTDALATIEVPDTGWEVTKIERGIEVTSSDDEVYLGIEGITKDNTADVMTEALAYLNRSGVKVDKASEKQTQGKLNGLDVLDFGWKGTDKDGEVVVHLTLVKIKPGKAILFTYWASPEGDKKYDPVTTKITASLKPL